MTKNDIVRVWVRSKNATADSPLLTVVRERRAVLSWQIPLILKADMYSYNTVARTICPYTAVNSSVSGHVWVGLTTASETEIDYELMATKIRKENFDLKLGESKMFNATPSQPYYARYRMPEGVGSVLLEVKAWDNICLIMSVQPVGCPVYDLDNNVNFVGTFQTVTTKGAIPLYRSYMPEVYVVFVVRPSDSVCTQIETAGTLETLSDENRRKSVELVVKETLSASGYALGIGVTIAVFIVIYIIAFVLARVIAKRDEKEWIEFQAKFSAEMGGSTARYLSADSRKPLISVENKWQPSENYGAVDRGDSGKLGAVVQFRQSSDSVTPSIQRSVEDSIKVVEDIGTETTDKKVIRSKSELTVPDLACKPWDQSERKYQVYYWNLVTISVFYILPVVQLVWAYQNAVMATGNEDICFYNFLCCRPFLGLFAFNGIFSNAGFIFLGILFLFLVRWCDFKYARKQQENYELATKYGVPKHYGLFYTLGIALIMEGILSGCYHVCPNYTNFQFDTAFMYMISALGILKIYQMRHPDINAHSHVAYIVMAAVIFLSVAGTVWNTTVFWIVFSVCYVLLIFGLGAEFYYKGQWHLDKGFYQKIRHDWPENPRQWLSSTTYPDRAVFILIFSILNCAFLIFGLLTTPKDFGSHLLSIFILNLLLYLCYYIAMKVRHGEKVGLRPWSVVGLTVVSWSAALYFYFHTNSDWTVRRGHP